MARRLLPTILAGFAAAAPLPAQQPAPPPPAMLTAALAEAVVDGCRKHAAAKRQSHAIAVVDGGGHLVAALRMDGNRAGIMDFAFEKAKAVAAWGFSTAQMEEAAKGTPGFARAPGVVTVAGGVPVYSADGRTLIGAAGTSGEAPADDAACAEAGIKAAGLRSQRAR
ncbi:MAG TPA: heme-binding protein [Allosphingosinicella sp.]|nr:heme-binding protein [Allosphingosinicella sp.]